LTCCFVEKMDIPNIELNVSIINRLSPLKEVISTTNVVLKDLLISDKVKFIRLKIMTEHGHAMRFQENLILNGAILNNEMRLIDYNINNNSQIKVVLSVAKPITAKLLFSNAEYDLKINELDRIIDLKNRIRELYGFEVINQHLSVENCVLAEDEAFFFNFGYRDEGLKINLIQNFGLCTVNVFNEFLAIKTISFQVYPSTRVEDVRFIMMSRLNSVEQVRNCLIFGDFCINDDNILCYLTNSSNINLMLDERTIFDMVDEVGLRLVIRGFSTYHQTFTLSLDSRLNCIPFRLMYHYKCKIFGANFRHNDRSLNQNVNLRQLNLSQLSIIDLEFNTPVQFRVAITGQCFQLLLNLKSSIQYVKTRIHQLNYDMPIERQILLFNEKLLENQLPASLIHGGQIDVILLNELPNTSVRILVHSFNRTLIFDQVPRTTTILRIKAQIQEETHIPIEKQLLVNSPYQPCQLFDYLSISQNELAPESNQLDLHLLSKLDKRLYAKVDNGPEVPYEVSGFDSVYWLKSKVLGDEDCDFQYYNDQLITGDLEAIKLYNYEDNSIIHFISKKHQNEMSYLFTNKVIEEFNKIKLPKFESSIYDTQLSGDRSSTCSTELSSKEVLSTLPSKDQLFKVPMIPSLKASSTKSSTAKSASSTKSSTAKSSSPEQAFSESKSSVSVLQKSEFLQSTSNNLIPRSSLEIIRALGGSEQLYSELLNETLETVASHCSEENEESPKKRPKKRSKKE